MLHNLQWVILPIPTTYIVKAILEKKKMGPIINQIIETKKPTNFTSQLIQVGLFEVFEQVPSFAPIPIHTRTCLKHMMWRKGKEVMEDTCSFTRVSWKQALIEGKEI
jgi:hypothetical protein